MKKKNKLLALFMAFVMIFSTLVVPVKEAFAASVEWGKGINTHYYWGPSGDITIKKVKANGKIEPAFCLEPGKSVTTIEGYKETYPKLPQKVWKKLCKIAHVGYNKEKNTNADFAATQAFIWMTIREDVDGWKVDWSQPTNIPNYKKRFDDIRTELKNIDKLVTTDISFDKTSVTLNINKSVTLTDTNKVLSRGYKVGKLPEGIKASISGNKLILKATAKAPNSFKLYLNVPSENMVTDNRYFYHPSSQHVGHVGYIDPIDAEITIKVNKYGKAEVTKKSESGKAIKGAKFNIKNADGTVSKNGTTNDNGKILFSNLAPGTYTVTETSVPSPYLIDKTPKTVTVKANDIGEVSFTNNLPRGKFTLTKTKENGSPLVGAKFRIWSVGNDPEGNAIGYDNTFTTNKNGKINVTGLKLGTYNYQEIAAPNGYVLDSTVRSFNLTYKNSSTAVVTSTGSVKNMMPRGEFKLVKNGVDGSKLAGAEYRVWSVGSDPEGTAINFDKVFTTDKNGELNVTGLKLGAYKYQEVKAPTGYVLDETVGDFTLSYKDQNTAVVGTSAKRVDKKIEIKKLDVNGKLVAGAELKVVDKDNKVVDSWTSTGDVHKISNLKEGESYTLVEVKAPAGYVLANPVPFTVTTDKEDQTVEMTDQQVSLIKKDVDGNVVTGATFDIIDKETGNVVDTVSPTEKPVYISNLKEGKTYIVREAATPEGYVTAKDIEFTVSDKIKEIQPVEVVNKQIVVKKTDFGGENVVGAELKVVDKDNKVVDSWTVEEGKPEHFVSGLKEGETYTLYEDYAPDGYVIAKPITFDVTEKKVNQPPIVMIDKQVEFIKTDVDGNVISGMEYTVTHKKSKQIVDKGVTSSKSRNFLNGLKVGETYTITETKVPKDFALAKPKEFTVTYEDKLQVETLENKKVTVKKTDLGGENVVGAELKVIDKETGDVVDSWIVEEGKPEHIVQGLEELREYTLIEDYAPEGYTISNSIDFIVSGAKIDGTKEDQPFEMIDKIVDVDKVNVDGESLKGVKLQIVNKKTKQIVDEWITDGNPHKVSLVEGMEYTLIELESIEGYALAAPFDFTVTYDKKTQHIVMTDKKVQFKKLGRDDKTLTGGKFEIKDKETGDVVDTISAEKDFIDIDNLVEGKTYIITETKAPYGYQIGEDVEFTVSYDKKTQKLVMKDIPKEGRIIVTDDNDFGGDEWYEVETGDKFGLAMLLMLLIASGIGTVVLGADRKKKHR